MSKIQQTLGITIILWLNTSMALPLKILHYNIKELDSTKIADKDNQQISLVKNIIKAYDFDILSLNEIQYDTPGIPNSQYKTRGDNLNKLIQKWELKGYQQLSFHPANTGKNAKSKADGSYYTTPDEMQAREHADQLNFGTMPGQYSTAAIIRPKLLDEFVINDLKWKQFNPRADFSKFKTANGSTIPEDMLLFDKNFTDLTIQYEGKTVHIILLHAVPSFGFGNPNSINDFRNAEQLRFLEWYTTGKTDYPTKLKGIEPLPKGSYFIATGDFNVDINDTDSAGSKVLKNIFKKTNTWIPVSQMSFTNETFNSTTQPLRLMLDYMFTSRNIKAKQGKIIHPDFTKTEYQNFKLASDHYPIYGEFILK